MGSTATAVGFQASLGRPPEVALTGKVASWAQQPVVVVKTVESSLRGFRTAYKQDVQSSCTAERVCVERRQ